MKVKHLDEATSLASDATKASVQLVNNERAINQMSYMLFELQHDLRDRTNRLPADLTSVANRILRTLEICGLIDHEECEDEVN